MSIAHSPTEKSSLFTEETWKQFANRIEDNFELKKYPQFDPYFNFPKEKNRLKEVLAGHSGKSVANHSFLPFVKIIVKTPRFKYQEDQGGEKMNLTAKQREQFHEFEIKPRPISFASHFDTYLYAYYSFVLTEKYQLKIREKGFDECVLAYRTDLDGKSNIQFAKEAFEQVKALMAKGPCTTIALDIKGYFDSIDHQLLKKRWCDLINRHELPADQYKVYRSLTNYSYASKNSLLKHFGVDLAKRKSKEEHWRTLLDLIPDEIAGKGFKEKFGLLRERDLIVTNKPKEEGEHLTRKGIPQGSSISAFLSNLYLFDFDQHFHSLSKTMGFVYRRYCDDLLFICPSAMSKEIQKEVLTEIDKCGLKIQTNKTELIEFKKNSKGVIRAFDRKKIEYKSAELNSANEGSFYKNLQYLGFEFNGTNVYIRPGSLSRYFRKMRGRITKTIMMARGKNSKSNEIFRAQLYHRYTHLGKKNFLTYAHRAS
ncbi:MAG: reverse transcriptase/maturase family protein, partial [Bacteroidota bacterium]